MERDSTASIRLQLLLLSTLFAVVVWRTATLPVTVAEAVTWDSVVRPPARALLVTPGAWSGFLYGLLAKRSAGLFRLSEFSLRLPEVLGCLIYFYALHRIAFQRIWALFLLAIAPILMNCFNLAGGSGLALGLSALALAQPSLAGPCIGVAVAACPQIGIVPATAAAGLIYGLGFWRGMERVVIPAVAVAFVLLILPLSHGGAPIPQPAAPGRLDAAVRSAIGILQVEAGKTPARISASPAVAPLVEFYRARYRRREWVIGPVDPHFFLWITPDRPPSGPLPSRILFEQDGVVLAR